MRRPPAPSARFPRSTPLGPRQWTASSASGAARRCIECTPSGDARNAASRPIAAAGNRGRDCAMTRIESNVDVSSAAFRANRERMQVLLAELQARAARAREGGGGKYIARHRELGKLTVRERLEHLLDPGKPFL